MSRGAERPALPPRGGRLTGIGPDVGDWLARRSAAFVKATQGRDAPGHRQTYGAQPRGRGA